MKTKWYYNRDEVGRFTNGKSMRQKIGMYTKYYLLQSAKVMIIAWMVVGGLKVGQHYSTPVYADREVIKEITKEAPVLARIARCESGNKHVGSNGQVILNANNNGSVDIGVMQINERIWGKKATELGLNLWVEKDNRAFAQYLYENFGSEPWIWSKGCWNK